MDTQENEYLSAKEFAALIHVHYNTVLRAIKRGRLSAFRIGEGNKCAYRISRYEINRIALMDMEEFVSKIIEEKIK